MEGKSRLHVSIPPGNAEVSFRWWSLGILLLCALAGIVKAMPSFSSSEINQQKGVRVFSKQSFSSGDNQAFPCTTGLRDAINAAIAEIQSSGFVADELFSRYPDVPYIPFLGCPPKSEGLGQSLWPSVDSLHPSDLLLRVLERGELRVASYGPRPPTAHPAGPDRSFRGYDWSYEANYSLDSPTGFFPDYLRRIVEEIGNQYGTKVQVKWLFYTGGAACIKAVMDGECDMTDIYFLQAVQVDNSSTKSTIERLYSTCPVIGSGSMFITRKDLRIKTLSDVIAHINQNPGNEAETTVAYLTDGNYRSTHFLLPEETTHRLLTRAEALSEIRSGKIFGLFAMNNVTPEDTDLQALHTGVVVAMGPWLRRTDTGRCLAYRFRHAVISYRLSNGGRGRNPDVDTQSAEAATILPSMAFCLVAAFALSLALN